MSKRSDALYVRDIKEAIEAIFAYTRDITFDDFNLNSSVRRLPTWRTM
jgi:uncharacterized protein with HEPN domain